MLHLCWLNHVSLVSGKQFSLFLTCSTVYQMFKCWMEKKKKRADILIVKIVDLPDDHRAKSAFLAAIYLKECNTILISDFLLSSSSCYPRWTVVGQPIPLPLCMWGTYTLTLQRPCSTRNFLLLDPSCQFVCAEILSRADLWDMPT